MLSSKKVAVYFLVNNGHEEDASDEMRKTFQDCLEASLKPEYISDETAMQLGAQNDVVVIENFEGDTFQYLSKQKCVICGPRCLQVCLAEGTPIPETKSPVFITSMRGLVITASNIPPAMKRKIREKVGFMGGTYTTNLVESVTQLVSAGVHSVKYNKAAEIGIPIMSVDWIDAVWQEGLKRNVHATDPQFQRYKCPIFLNLEITTSNMPTAEKEKMKRLINENGGKYSKELRQNQTCVLVISNPSNSQKYQHAQSWGLPCVYSSWVLQSVEKGYAVPSTDHLVGPKVHCSTPTEMDKEMPSFSASEISVLTIPQQSNRTHVNETQQTCEITLPHSQAQQKPMSNRCPPVTSSYNKSVIENLNVTIAKHAGAFLDGCKVYLSGFKLDEQDKLRRILNLGGATIFTELSETVSHVISGDFVAADAKAMNRAVNRPHVLKVEWLAASLKQRCAASEALYSRFGSVQVAADPEPPSPLSQKGMQLLRKGEFKTPEQPQPPPKEQEPENGAQVPNVNRKLFQDFLKNGSPNPNSIQTNAEQDRDNDNLEEIPNNMDSTCDEDIEIFKGLVFLYLGFDSNTSKLIENMIMDNGGEVVTQSFKGLPDYTVVPLEGSSLGQLQSEVVTHYWLEDCNEAKKLLPIEYYHQPITVAGGRKPLEDCVVTITIYSKKERLFLSQLVKVLGAVCQEVFSRKHNAAKEVLSSTHLVSASTGSSKYKAALRWKVPVVTKDWLIACAKLGNKVPESSYAVIEEGQTDVTDVADTPFGNAISKTNGICTKNEETPKGIPRSMLAPKVLLTTPQPSTSMESCKTVSNPPTETSRTTSVSTTLPSPTSSYKENIGDDERASLPALNKGNSLAATPSNFTSPLLSATPFNNSADRKSGGSTPGYKCISDMPTPEFPYEEIFPESGKNARKRIKRWVEKFDSEKPKYGTPPKARRMSTPISDLIRRGLRKFGPTPDTSLGQTDSPGDEKPPKDRINGTSKDINTSITTSTTTPTSSTTTSSPSVEERMARLSKKLLTPSVAGEQITRRCSSTNQRSSSTSRESDECSPQIEAPATLRSALNMDSQPGAVGWEEPVEKAEKARFQKLYSDSSDMNAKNMKFMFSNVEQFKRERLECLIESLGASLLKTEIYCDETTHLITDCPVRSEKLLCSIAAGHFVLHSSYVEESHNAGYFLKEENFEWGNELSETNVPELLTEREHLLAKAAARWRIKLSEDRTCTGAYEGMAVVIFSKKEKLRENLTHLITAGGGIVLDKREIHSATFCLVEDQYNKHIDVPTLASKNIFCLPPAYLGDFLVKDPPPKPESCAITV